MKVNLTSEIKYHLYDNDKMSQSSLNKISSKESKKGGIKETSPADPTRRLSVIKETTEEIIDKTSPAKITKITEQKKDK